MPDLTPGAEYKVIAKTNQHYRERVILQSVAGGVGVALVAESPYPFLPSELEAVAPTPPKPRRTSPARRAAIYRELLERVATEWTRMPRELREELVRALEL